MIYSLALIVVLGTADYQIPIIWKDFGKLYRTEAECDKDGELWKLAAVNKAPVKDYGYVCIAAKEAKNGN